VRTQGLVDRVLPLAAAGQVPALLQKRGELKGKLLLDCAGGVA
jgi:hypothetical protein